MYSRFGLRGIHIPSDRERATVAEAGEYTHTVTCAKSYSGCSLLPNLVTPAVSSPTLAKDCAWSTFVCFSSVGRAPTSSTEPSVDLESRTICRRTSDSGSCHTAVSESAENIFIWATVGPECNANTFNCADYNTLTAVDACPTQDSDARVSVLVRSCPGIPRRWLPAGHWRSCKTTAFRRHEDADCPPNIQLFWRQDFCNCCHKSLELFAVRLTKSRVIILPVQAVDEDIFIWTARAWHIVNSINCTV